MWRPLLHRKITYNQQLREYADVEYGTMSELYKKIANCPLKQEVNTYIEEKKDGWLYRIKEVLKKEEYADLKNWDDELWLMHCLCECSEKERTAGRLSLLYRCNSLNQIREIYQITVFYLTRIEFDMEKEFYINFLQFIKEWNLSPEYIVMVIQRGSIADKSGTAKRFANIMKKYGEECYGEEVLKGIQQ